MIITKGYLYRISIIGFWRLLITIVFLLFITPSWANNSLARTSNYNNYCQQDSIISALKEGNLRVVINFIKLNGPNAIIADSSASILTYSVFLNNIDLVRLIIQNGADVNMPVNDYTPLMICSTNNYIEVASFLIKKGANVDYKNSVKNTALIIASRYGNKEMVKLLTSKAANPFIKNQTRQTAYDYAQSYNKLDVAKMLEKAMSRYARNKMSEVVDGPHVFMKDDKRVTINYIIHDPIKRKTIIRKEKKSWENDEISFTNPYGTNKKIVIKKDNLVEDREFVFSNISKVFVVGDVHGEYIPLLKLLKSNKIIDSDLSWTFSQGHLVFIGDIFDRGENVTELLWLIYKLELEAKLAGGKVHFLFGNHELMVLQNDHRYVHEKYEYLSAAIRINYSYLFSNETFLGKWLRTKNVAIVIDSVLFVHAGISTELVEKEVSIYEINSILRALLNEKESPGNIGLAKRNIVTEENGPLWFRGYFGENAIIPKISEEEFQKSIDYYRVNKIIIGHTEVSKIQPIYNGMVIPVDVPFNRDGIQAQGLLIVNKKFYRCFDDGTVEIIEE